MADMNPTIRKQHLQAFDRDLRVGLNLIQQPGALRRKNRFAMSTHLAGLYRPGLSITL